MRTLVAWSLGIAAGIFGFASGVGLTGSIPIALALAAVTAGLVARLGHKHAILVIEASACPRGLSALSGTATLVALVQLSRLAIFMVDPSQVGYSSMPSSQFEVQHSCLSAYYVAAQAADTVPNLYDDSLYSLPADDPTAIRKPRMLGPFRIDVFEYPPPFLLLPRALLNLTPDFIRLRALWFGLSGGVILLAMLVVARSLGPVAGTRALLLSPFVWMALPSLSNLQKGNVQAPVIATSMLAMVLFEKRRWASGGALLAFVTVSKLYPGLLVLYLLARRQWRAVAWTAALGFAWCAGTLLLLGWAPYAAFLDHLPGLVGGEAFPAFRNPAAMAINFSIPGLVFKLGLFEVPGMSFGAAKIVGWMYTLVAIAATVVTARRSLPDSEKPLVWMAILILATLRSPFLPQGYAAFPSLWLLTLLVAGCAPTSKTVVRFMLAWAALNVYWPTDWAIDPRLLASVNLVPQTVTILLAVLALRRRTEVSPA
jgi:hypothetical protein